MNKIRNTLELKPFPGSDLTIRGMLFGGCIVLCLSPFISQAAALLMGILFSWIIGSSFLQKNQKITQLILQASVIGLGFGMNAHRAYQAGKEGIVVTIVTILFSLLAGYLLGRWVKIDRKTSYLISVGTAICGGSAIAAISPVIKAKATQISVGLGVVFILNAIALLLFPAVGDYLHLSQREFGLWCAIAIHDTSSVVGAASKYGDQALEVATTIKLTRALWIMPVAFLSGVIFKTRAQKIRVPYFILLFMLAMLANVYVPGVAEISPYLVRIAKGGLTLSLFLIGCGLTKELVKSVGPRSFVQGGVLWLLISSITLLLILFFRS